MTAARKSTTTMAMTTIGFIESAGVAMAKAANWLNRHYSLSYFKSYFRKRDWPMSIGSIVGPEWIVGPTR